MHQLQHRFQCLAQEYFDMLTRGARTPYLHIHSWPSKMDIMLWHNTSCLSKEWLLMLWYTGQDTLLGLRLIAVVIIDYWDIFQPSESSSGWFYPSNR